MHNNGSRSITEGHFVREGLGRPGYHVLAGIPTWLCLARNEMEPLLRRPRTDGRG